MRSRMGTLSISALRPDRPATGRGPISDTWSWLKTVGPIPDCAGFHQAPGRLRLLAKKGCHDAGSLGKGNHQFGIVFLRSAFHLFQGSIG